MEPIVAAADGFQSAFRPQGSEVATKCHAIAEILANQGFQQKKLILTA